MLDLKSKIDIENGKLIKKASDSSDVLNSARSNASSKPNSFSQKNLRRNLSLCQNTSNEDKASKNPWKIYDELRMKFEIDYRALNKSVENIQKQIIPILPSFKEKAMQDELKYLEALKKSEEFRTRHNNIVKDDRIKLGKEYRNSLLQQIKEKNEIIQKHREDDKVFKDILTERKVQAEVFDFKKRARYGERKADYVNSLKDQISTRDMERKKLILNFEDKKNSILGVNYSREESREHSYEKKHRQNLSVVETPSIRSFIDQSSKNKILYRSNSLEKNAIPIRRLLHMQYNLKS